MLALAFGAILALAPHVGPLLATLIVVVALLRCRLRRMAGAQAMAMSARHSGRPWHRKDRRLMPRSRNRLINAARRSMLQRSELHRRLDVARRHSPEGARRSRQISRRGKGRCGRAFGAGAIPEQPPADRAGGDRRHRMALREPIKEHAPKLARKVQDLAETAIEKIRPATRRMPTTISRRIRMKPLE
jgi:hypothetical protein